LFRAQLLKRAQLPKLECRTISALAGWCYCEGWRNDQFLMLLAVEANGVIALRMMKLMRGDGSAPREAELMVSEKIRAAFEATACLMAGASGDEVVNRRRRHVAAMRKRLDKLNLERRQNVPSSEGGADGSSSMALRLVGPPKLGSGGTEVQRAE
jgi:hypothetical protein